MTPQDLKKLLIDRNLTGAAIARRLGVRRQYVSAVLYWKSKAPWIRRGIAKELGIPYELAWGERDPGQDGMPRGRRSHRSFIAGAKDKPNTRSGATGAREAG